MKQQHTEGTKEKVLDLRGQGLSYMGIVRALADQDVEVSKSTVIRWTKDLQGPDSPPIEAEWTPTFNDQLAGGEGYPGREPGAGLDGSKDLNGLRGTNPFRSYRKPGGTR